MKILIATHNQSKFKRYQKILGVIDSIETISLADLNITEKVEENFATNTKNAIHKAKSYGKLSGMITVAIDEALLTNFLPDNEQPGVYARRFAKDKRELTDVELIDVWKKIFEMYPQEDKKFIWNFAVAFYNPADDSQGIQCVEEISHLAKYFSPIKSNGYPMSTFLSFERDGIPYIEINQKIKDEKDVENFASFVINFKKWLTVQ